MGKRKKKKKKESAVLHNQSISIYNLVTRRGGSRSSKRWKKKTHSGQVKRRARHCIRSRQLVTLRVVKPEWMTIILTHIIIGSGRRMISHIRRWLEFITFSAEIYWRALPRATCIDSFDSRRSIATLLNFLFFFVVWKAGMTRFWLVSASIFFCCVIFVKRDWIIKSYFIELTTIHSFAFALPCFYWMKFLNEIWEYFWLFFSIRVWIESAIRTNGPLSSASRTKKRKSWLPFGVKFRAF